MVLTMLMFPTMVVIVISGLNTVAVYYDTVNAILALVIVKMVGIWLFVALPLAVIGTIFGRHLVGKVDVPCRVNSFPR
jgi:transmembrane 9 superfamily protein 3